jgi:pimeloyl-ACP methyl ester carboxylesterase
MNSGNFSMPLLSQVQTAWPAVKADLVFLLTTEPALGYMKDNDAARMAKPQLGVGSVFRIWDTGVMRLWLPILISTLGFAQEHISFPASDGWIIAADLYGSADRAVVLVHGGRFLKESWAKLAAALSNAGFRVLAIDLRGFGASKEGPADLRSDYGSPLDVLAAVHYLHDHGAKTVSVVGASMGGDATEGAIATSRLGEIDRIVLLAHGAYGSPEKLNVRKMFVVARDDSDGKGFRLTKIQSEFDRAPDPKELIVLEGSAHAQFLFQTGQSDRLMHEILGFLSKP